MTPKEKAKELVEKMFNQRFVIAGSYSLFQQVSKACAIICVDEIIKDWEIFLNMEDQEYPDSPLKFWQSVKTEINNL